MVEIFAQLAMAFAGGVAAGLAASFVRKLRNVL